MKPPQYTTVLLYAVLVLASGWQLVYSKKPGRPFQVTADDLDTMEKALKKIKKEGRKAAKSMRKLMEQSKENNDDENSNSEETDKSLITKIWDDLRDTPKYITEKKKQREEIRFATNTADKLLYELKNFEHSESNEEPKALPQFNPTTHQEGTPNMVIGISSVNRKKNYLLNTIRDIFKKLLKPERKTVKIVVMNGDVPPEKHTDVPLLETEFQSEIESGLLVIEQNPRHTGHKQLETNDKLTLRWGDNIKRVKWRSKQVLDVTMLMRKCHHHAQQGGYGYFLMLEDDVKVAEGFPTAIRSWVDKHLSSRTDWTVASFYNPWKVADREEIPAFKFFGVIGQLFRTHDLPHITSFLGRNFDESPLDWLFVDYLTKHKGKMIAHAPSLFQHLGVVSSLSDKIQPSRAAEFDEFPLR
eukprot:TRINITY_DN27510_c0_g1_i1.p1 TRINITY_DN27510_c0_g1~~TRINITY_DN27510_c0_g1_i1.p1  ORF type:complete len:443 (+),score=83.77 TRINITY_DN27510_c0_g1_i1:88-1329(+)